MKSILSSMKHYYIARVMTFLVMVALIVGMAVGVVGCGDTPTEYTLSVSSSMGGNVTHPGTGTFTYPAGALVLLEVEPEEGYGFTHWSGNVSTIADVNSATTSITMNGHYLITANFAYGNFIQTWYDLDDIRNDLGGYCMLMNDLDFMTPGYAELASDVANQGEGWQPIGYRHWDGEQWVGEMFQGIFDGQGYEISNLFINRPSEYAVGFFGCVGEGGVIKNAGVINADVTGENAAGSLVGLNEMGTVNNCYATGSVTGGEYISGTIGGLVGRNIQGTVSNCYAMSSVSGGGESGYGIGGLMGENSEGTVSNCYATGNVTGGGLDSQGLGGLIGLNGGTVTNCYATGSVTCGIEFGVEVGGLIGQNDNGTVSDSYATGSVTGGGEFSGDLGGLIGSNRYSTVSNSHYNYDDVLINGECIITIGALFDADFKEWLANDMSLDISERLSIESGYYVIDNVSDFKQLLAFGQDSSLRFRLKNDLDLATEPNFYIPYLAGEFDGGGYRISNLNFDFDFVSNVGLFGCLAPSGDLHELGVENVNVAGYTKIGGLVGYKDGANINDCYSTGSVTGYGSVGGLVGSSHYGTMSNAYSTAIVTGDYYVGGLVGFSSCTMNDCYSTGNVTGIMWVGGLVSRNNDIVSNSYSTGSVTGNQYVGGLVGVNGGTVNNSFWDTDTSGQATSDGGMGKNTTEMKDIATFSGATWDIIAVANPSTRNASYIWNIVDDETYPFLSWQPVS